jgi:hypothetical protein
MTDTEQTPDDTENTDNMEIPIHGRKALQELEGETITDTSEVAGGISLTTQNGTFKIQALTEEVTVEYWAENDDE